MTRFKFELEPLLQMNAAVADLRESELHKCRQDVARRETAILKIQEERQQLYQSTFGRVVDPVELRRTLFQIECLDEDIKPIQNELRFLDRKIGTLTSVLRELHRQGEILRDLRVSDETAFRMEQRRREKREQDEVASLYHEFRSRDKKRRKP